MYRQNAKKGGGRPWKTRKAAACAGLLALLAPAAFGQAPGIEFPLNQSAELAAEPGSLTTFAAALPAVSSGLDIRYQVDVAWLTSESPSAGGTHDSFFFSLLSPDGSQAVPLFGVDVFGIHPEPAVGFSLQIEPLARPDPSLENSLAYRVFITPSTSFQSDGSWAVIDLADTGDLGGCRALVSVGMVPEPEALALTVAGGALLCWSLRYSGKRGRR